MRKSHPLIVLILILFVVGCGGPTAKNYLAAPSLLPSTGRQMKTSGFWISQHPAPDQVIMNPAEIAAFNSSIENKLKLTRDITKLSESYAETLGAQFEEELKKLRRRNLFRKNGQGAGGRFWREIKTNLALDQLAFKIRPQYGFIVHYANQRVLPTEEILSEIQFDVDFDELQNSSLDVGTPVAILHVSADEKWYYTMSSLSSGWVEIKHVAIGDMNQVKKYFSNSSFVAVTKPKADIFLNDDMTEYYDYARMGVAFPSLERTGGDAVEITIPVREKDGTLQMRSAYVRADQVNQGFLPYTPRTILVQAFEMLNQPYGWGGMYGEQDCSAFLQEIFATVGIYLPRNSTDQAKVGRLLAQFEKDSKKDAKVDVLKREGGGGSTVLAMPGHILLYLGMYKEDPYAIHATWAYRERGDTPRVINRVVVSDLDLGEGSRKGSLMKRLSSVRSIEK